MVETCIQARSRGGHSSFLFDKDHPLESRPLTHDIEEGVPFTIVVFYLKTVDADLVIEGELLRHSDLVRLR